CQFGAGLLCRDDKGLLGSRTDRELDLLTTVQSGCRKLHAPGHGWDCSGIRGSGRTWRHCCCCTVRQIALEGSLRRSRRLHGEGGHVDRHDAVEAVEGWI